ncbi:hypothetical protein ACFC8N_15125 [Streptomyces sp. NPDC055966]|uniref:hypothetical protein n=1 Tax=Streptomyces sp. NPDC055966 TaxID=3345669 RepID=UPI0035DE4CD7
MRGCVPCGDGYGDHADFFPEPCSGAFSPPGPETGRRTASKPRKDCRNQEGCLEGAPAIVAGTGIAGAGIYGITDGISRFSNGLGQALREADSNGGGGSLGSDKYWPNGKASDVCGIERSTGCEQVAESIQQSIGGNRMRVTDRYGAPTLGKYREQDSFWGHHDVVVKDGRVYDAWTGSEGEPLDEYRGKFEYGDDLVFTPLD